MRVVVGVHRDAEVAVCLREAGAGDRETALRWMAMEETFYGKQDVEHWVYKHGFLFTSHGRAVVEELMNIVTFKEFDDE